MLSDTLVFAFTLTFLAGISTSLGSIIAFFSKTTNKTFFAFSLGFSAGIMIFVSFVEMFGSARTSLTQVFGEKWGLIYTCVAFFFGVFFIAIIDFLIPEAENPHEIKDVEETNEKKVNEHHALKRLGITTALVIGIHNFPEGVATLIAGTQDFSIAMSVAIAIAIHNIPEGIAVSVPIYFATKSKKKAFIYSSLSGLSEPIGALIGYFFFSQYFSTDILSLVFAFVAGIMVFISIDELLPAAQSYGKHHVSINGFITGMLFLAISLILFL